MFVFLCIFYIHTFLRGSSLIRRRPTHASRGMNGALRQARPYPYVSPPVGYSRHGVSSLDVSSLNLAVSWAEWFEWNLFPYAQPHYV